MGIIAKDTSGEFEPIPAGLHRAICINVFDIGYQLGYQGKPPCHQVVILWEIEAVSPKSGQKFTVTKFYTLSLADKANLRADLVSWRGRQFTEDELKGFDLDNIKGKACQLNLVPKAPDSDRVVISSVLPAQRVLDQSLNKMVVTEHWKPETGNDYVPAFVQKKIDGQIDPPGMASQPKHEEAFTDDIPF